MGLAGRFDRGERTTGKHVTFLAALWSRSVGYLSGFVGAIILVIWVWRTRGGTSLESKSELRHARERPNHAKSSGGITPAAP
jgi:hypothetical protein